MDFSAVGNILKDFFVEKTPIQWILFGVTCIAIVEWFTFLVINIRTFLNVLRNPDKTTGVGRTVFLMILYVVIRCLFLPFYLAGLSVNIAVYEQYQPVLYKISTTLLTVWWNAVILLPCVTVWYSRLRYGIGNKARGDTREVYNFIIVLPVYNETLKLLTEGVESMLKSNYTSSHVQIHVSFDNDEMSELYMDFARHFNIEVAPSTPSVSAVINGMTVWLHRFPHSGKRLTQAQTWDFIKGVTTVKDSDKTILLFTDSDNYIYDNALTNLAYNFERNPRKLAFAGYMTCMTMNSGWGCLNPWRWLQDTEYVGGEMNRGFEMLMGTVNCLPGGFTAMRWSAFASVADIYFRNLADDTITDFHRNYLGEDRYLTHILHENLPRHSMGFCPSARAKTDPPTTFMGLVRQRRRWYLGAISNEAYMFTSKEVWKRYRFMICYKFAQLCLWRSYTLTQLILAILMVNGMRFSDGFSGFSAQVFAMVVPLGISWLMISETGWKINHIKVMFVYPFQFIPQTLISLWVDWYTVFTWSTRSWGGARTQKKNVVVEDVVIGDNLV